MYPGMRLVHVFLDNARCHHANSIERLWALMQRHITHNKCYSTSREFSTAMLTLPRGHLPKSWNDYCDEQFPCHNPNGVPDYRVNGV
jgi:hypothetical protein